MYDIIKNDPKIQQLTLRKNLSKSRLKHYRIVFSEIFDLTGKTPSELIENAKEDQQPYIKDDKIVFKGVEDREVTTYYYKYYEYLLNKKNISMSTIDVYLKVFRALYNEYGIDLPKNIQLDVEKKIIKEGDIPNRDNIRKALDYTNNIRNKAIITLLASSGIRSGDVRNFKIKDFVEATKDYHDSNTIHELLENKNIKNIIPCWHFKPLKTHKKGNICVTFNTPECSEYIIDYLRKRENLDNNSYLFISRQNNKLSNAPFIHIFRNINDNVFFKTQHNKRFFHAHALRKFFISTCNHNSGDLAKVNLLSGHSNKSNVHDAYNEVNVEVMKRFYIKLIPHLSVRDTKVHEYKPQDMIKLENKVKSLEKEKNDDLEWVSNLRKKYGDGVFQKIIEGDD